MSPAHYRGTLHSVSDTREHCRLSHSSAPTAQRPLVPIEVPICLQRHQHSHYYLNIFMNFWIWPGSTNHQESRWTFLTDLLRGDCRAVDVIGQLVGRKGGEQSHVMLSAANPILHNYITTVSYLGNKDMISSGAHFLSALKSVAGKIWSTVIMEDDKDGRVPGRAPGAPQHPGDGSAASAVSLQSLWMPYRGRPALQEEKQVGRTATICSLSARSAGEQRQCGGESESCFHGNWSSKKVYRNQCHLSTYVSVQPHSNKKLFSCQYHEIVPLWDCPDQSRGSRQPCGAQSGAGSTRGSPSCSAAPSGIWRGRSLHNDLPTIRPCSPAQRESPELLQAWDALLSHRQGRVSSCGTAQLICHGIEAPVRICRQYGNHLPQRKARKGWLKYGMVTAISPGGKSVPEIKFKLGNYLMRTTEC